MKRLATLPLKVSFEIAFKSIRVRFFRSLITTISLVLAVAFLTFTQSSDNVAQSIALGGDNLLLTRLIKDGYDISPENLTITTSPKQRWIVFLSLLVCIVGIVNAQLMSVTERFREIGTMKCLGALDGVVVRIFILEAGIQGIIGAVAGGIGGVFFCLLSSIIKYGVTIIPLIMWSDIGISFCLAIATGTGLSLLGALYPAVLAARMQPVEAMRVDQ